MEGTTAERLQSILYSKAAIKSAIEGKGQEVGNIPLSQYAAKITAIETGTAGEMLNVSLETNQTDKSDLIGVAVTVTLSETSEVMTQTWNGEVLTFEIPAYSNYSVSVGTLEGYSMPTVQNYVAATGNIRVITLYLNSEWATITLTTEDGAGNVGGRTVTVNNKDYIYAFPFVAKIPYGIEYSVSVNALDGYDAAPIQSFVANSAARTITVEYPTIKLGIYILATDGKLVKRADWAASGKTAVGVAVMSTNCRFCIAPEQSSSPLTWGGYGTTISNITTTTDSNTAKTDYLGSSNTDKIIAQLGAANAPAANYCKTYVFRNGATGYLGAEGEWWEAYSNKAEIALCMSAIGGTAIDMGNYHWSSTQYNAGHSWLLYWNGGRVGGSAKDSSNRVRAFSAF